MQSEIISGYAKKVHRWLVCNTDPKKRTTE